LPYATPTPAFAACCPLFIHAPSVRMMRKWWQGIAGRWLLERPRRLLLHAQQYNRNPLHWEHSRRSSGTGRSAVAGQRTSLLLWMICSLSSIIFRANYRCIGRRDLFKAGHLGPTGMTRAILALGAQTASINLLRLVPWPLRSQALRGSHILPCLFFMLLDERHALESDLAYDIEC